MAGGEELKAMSGLAQAAYIEATCAAGVIPAALPIVAIIYEGQSDPQQIWQAADGWKETIAELENAQRAIEDLSRRVGEEQWKGDDRTAFEERMHDYVNQIDGAIVMAWAVVSVLYTVAVLIAVFIVLMFVIAGLLALLAAAILVALMTVVGAPEAAALEAEGTAFAEGCFTVLNTAETALKFTFWGAAAILGGFLAGNMTMQYSKGNKEAFTNLAQATLNARDDMLKGTLNYLEQKLTSKMVKGENITVLGRSNVFGRPIPTMPVNVSKGVAGKGLVDVFTGGPTASGMVPGGDSYGSKDGDGDGRSDGEEYVDETQPH